MSAHSARVAAGDRAKTIALPSLDGTVFNTSTLHGRRYLLAFFRFASCPFCNLRLAQLVRRHAELDPEFGVVAVFDSPLDNLQRHAERHAAPFPILAGDARTGAYADYGIERSVGGMLKGMFLRMPTLVRGMAKGYLPIRPRGSMITMPADFLIDAGGIVQTAYYGRDEGDHLPFEAIAAFANALAPARG